MYHNEDTVCTSIYLRFSKSVVRTNEPTSMWPWAFSNRDHTVLAKREAWNQRLQAPKTIKIQ